MLNYSFIVLHVFIGVTITVNVLLTKKNVRSAIGWMGLVWFSPFVGAAIYYLFGINRVARRASRLGRIAEERARERSLSGRRRDTIAVPADGIMAIGSRAGGAEALGGNLLKALRDGDEAYPEMLDAIATAERSIAICMYIFRPDHVGEQFVAALIAAHRRGVEVRVLIDGVGGGYLYSEAIRRLKKAGIRAQRFLHDWLLWRMSFINLRNHKKLVIIDGRTGFIGGLNVGGENIWSRIRGREVSDMHFRVEGPVVGQLMESFADDWLFAAQEALEGDAWWPVIGAAGNSIARVTNSGPDEDLGNIETIFSAAIDQARERVRIVTPYFLPDEGLKTVISMAMLRGVRVELIIPAQSDHYIMDWAMQAHLDTFRDENFFCRTSTMPFDHSKLVTVDGKWSAVGSPNWDVRSMCLNFEILLECFDQETVAAIDRIVDEKFDRAQPHDINQTTMNSLPVNLRNAFARLFLPYL